MSAHRSAIVWTAMRPGTRMLYRLLLPHSGPRRAKRAKETLATSQGAHYTGISRGALGWCATVSVGLSVLVSAGSAAQEKAAPVFADGQAQIVPAFQDQAQWIRETLWV